MERSMPPVFLVGAPRSGTTLLYKALSLHPRAAHISNWVHRFPGLPQLAALDRLGRRFPGRRHRAWFPSGNAYAPGEARSWSQRAFPAPGEGEPVFSRAGITTAPVTELLAVGEEIRRLRTAFERIRRWSGGDVLLVKRIANNRRVAVLRAAFPEAKYVELVRDGRAVALSLSEVDWWPHMRMWWLGQTPPEWVAAGGDELELGILHWDHEVRALAEGLSHVDPDRRMQLRYEDLTSDPVGCLQRVASFVGLPAHDEGWTRSLGRMSFPNRNDRWRAVLDASAIARLERAAGPTLERYGYALSQELPRRQG